MGPNWSLDTAEMVSETSPRMPCLLARPGWGSHSCLHVIKPTRAGALVRTFSERSVQKRCYGSQEQGIIDALGCEAVRTQGVPATGKLPVLQPALGRHRQCNLTIICPCLCSSTLDLLLIGRISYCVIWVLPRDDSV